MLSNLKIIVIDRTKGVNTLSFLLSFLLTFFLFFFFSFVNMALKHSASSSLILLDLIIDSKKGR